MTNKVKEHNGFYYVFGDKAVYFDSFLIEYISQGILSKIKYKSITHNIFRKQFADFIMCGFYSIVFIE